VSLSVAAGFAAAGVPIIMNSWTTDKLLHSGLRRPENYNYCYLKICPADGNKTPHLTRRRAAISN